ncbi:MAG: hypothetical protein ACRD3P_13870 [Terriglobales bacterium]
MIEIPRFPFASLGIAARDSDAAQTPQNTKSAAIGRALEII